MKWELIYLATLVVGFGAFCVAMGHNSTVILSVFTAVGVIAGYVYGKKEEKKEESSES